MSDAPEDFDWSPLGETWWRESARSVSATARQAAFACAMHRGCSQTEAARLSGVSGSPSNLRASGYRMARAHRVQHLLALASAEADGGYDGAVDAAEARRILSSLARGSDPAVRIRAIEAIEKQDQRQQSIGEALDTDGYGEARLVRDYLRTPGGTLAFLSLYSGAGLSLANLELLHDVHAAAQRACPGLWDRLRQQMAPNGRVALDTRLNDPDWQRETREKIWQEVGVDLSADADGAAAPALEAMKADTARASGTPDSVANEAPSER